MARKKKEKQEPGDPMWLVTFSDLVTLLLTFFVLLLSMSSMDKSVITKVNIFTQDMGFMTYQSAGRIPSRIREVIELLETPLDLVDKPNRLKDLLFPDDVLPPDISRSMLEQNLEILVRPDGVALVLSDNLLFEPESSALTDPARKILTQVIEVLQYLFIDVNISGYTDNAPGDVNQKYDLSFDRSLSVLDFLTRGGVDQSRFSVAGYGPHLPLEKDEQAGEKELNKNNRVEIFLKTSPFIGSY